jgi:hypothetical protein
MNRLLPALLITVSAAVPFLEGCVIGQCDNNQKNCIQLEPATRFEGTPKTQSAAYASGQGVRIQSTNGVVKVTQGTSSQVEVTFQPFALDKKTNEAGASSAMQNNLILSASTVGNDVVVSASRKSGSSSGLGADITVKLPAGFNGAFEVDQDNGEVDVDFGTLTPAGTAVKDTGAGSLNVKGAAGPLDITTDVGDVIVTVAKWGAAGEDGTVHTGNGNISFTAPTAADGQLVLTANGKISIPSTLPASWAKNETATSTAFTMGKGAGGHVDVKNDFGDVALLVE